MPGTSLVCLVCLVYLVCLVNIYSFGMEVSRRWRLEMSSFGTGSEATPGIIESNSLTGRNCLILLV